MLLQPGRGFAAQPIAVEHVDPAPGQFRADVLPDGLLAIDQVGGIRHQNTLTKSDDNWSFGASIGPAADGRIKPDLSHFYDSTFTVTSGSNTAYTNFGGTSGATPIICGHIGLFFQMWSEGVFGNTIDLGGTVFENRSHLSTAKAMMINSANQSDFSGSTHDMSRFHQGWGMPDVDKLYSLRSKMLIVDETDLIENLETRTYTVMVSPAEPEFRAASEIFFCGTGWEITPVTHVDGMPVGDGTPTLRVTRLTVGGTAA